MSAASATRPPERDRPGFLASVPEEDYHADWLSASSSFLKTLDRRSPAHAQAERLAPRKETPALVMGKAADCRTLEPDAYTVRYVVLPKLDRHTTAGKTAYTEFVEAHPGATLIDEDDQATVEMPSRRPFTSTRWGTSPSGTEKPSCPGGSTTPKPVVPAVSGRTTSGRRTGSWWT